MVKVEKENQRCHIKKNGGSTRDDEEDSEDHDHLVVATTTRTLDDHVKAKLLKWFGEIPPGASKTFSVAIIVEPDTYQEALALARDTLVLQPTYNRAGYHRDILFGQHSGSAPQ